MERRSRRGHAKALPVQHRRRGHTRLIGRVRGQKLLPVNALLFRQGTADHFDRTLIRQRHQPARDRGHGIVDIPAGNRHGHRLGGLKELELDIQTGLLEILALIGHECAGMAGKAQRAQSDLFALRNSRCSKPDRGSGPHGRQCLAAVECGHDILPLNLRAQWVVA